MRALHERIYFRPLLEAFTGAPGAMDEAAAETRLAAFGFADAERTRQALQELTRGLTRSSRLMQQMLPLLLGWLSESPDPDLGLRLDRIVHGAQKFNYVRPIKAGDEVGATATITATPAARYTRNRLSTDAVKVSSPR